MFLFSFLGAALDLRDFRRVENRKQLAGFDGPAGYFSYASTAYRRLWQARSISDRWSFVNANRRRALNDRGVQVTLQLTNPALRQLCSSIWRSLCTPLRHE
jgi:hypothetical protein